MDRMLYSAATTGTDLDFITQNKDKLGEQRTGSGNTVLHVASQFGQLEAVKLILSLNQQLLLRFNDNLEYALHLAARGGHSSVVRELIDHAKAMPPRSGDIEGGSADKVGWAKDVTLKSENYGDYYTPLHEAVRNRHVDVVKILIEEDPEHSYDHKGGRKEICETPLYLAARRGFDELVEVIIKNCKSPAYRCVDGRTALHGAVISNSQKCAELLLNWSRPLATEIDSNRHTPLHYVAYLGYADLVSPLLLSDESAAYIKDAMRNNAIHIAASRGHVSVLKEILLRCPDSWDMEDVDGQNILHIAVKHQQENVIKYILEDCPIIETLINQKDYFKGNTPLHLVSIYNYRMPQLISHPMADKGVWNRDKMTPLDLVTINVDMSTTTKSEIAEELKDAGATFGLPFLRKEKAKEYDKERSIIEEQWKKVQTHIVVTTLIATITFAAGFTMPGGFIQSDGPYQGMSVLTKFAAFRAFIISDTIALVLSASAILIYFIGSIHLDVNHIVVLFFTSIFLNLLALLAMMVAFVTGIFVVLANSLALAIATSLLGSCFFLVYIVVIMKFVPKKEISHMYKKLCDAQFWVNWLSRLDNKTI